MPGPLYDERLAAMMRAYDEPQPYRPSNGTEGELFEARWCDMCAKDRLWRETKDGALGCMIHTNAVLWSVGDEDYPPEWTHDAQGQPCCTAFEAEEEDD